MVRFRGVSEPIPVWVSVPDVNRWVFIGTRLVDEYGHPFYKYATGTSLDSLTPLVAEYEDAEEIAAYTQAKLLPFVSIDKIVRFVPETIWELAEFGLERREHIVLTPDSRWYLNSPIAEVNYFAMDDAPVEVVVNENGLLSFEADGAQFCDYDNRGRVVPLVIAHKIEVHYAIARRPDFPDDAIAYKVAAKVLRAQLIESSQFFSSIRVGAVSFSFRDAKDISKKASELDRLAYRLLREVVGY